MKLRDHSEPCEHDGQYGNPIPDRQGDSYRFGHRTGGLWCPGGREVTIDPEAMEQAWYDNATEWREFYAVADYPKPPPPWVAVAAAIGEDVATGHP